MNVNEKKNLKFRNQLESLNSDDSKYKSESSQKEYPTIKTTNNVTSPFDTKTSKKETKANSLHVKRIKTAQIQSKNKKIQKKVKSAVKYEISDKLDLYQINKKNKKINIINIKSQENKKKILIIIIKILIQLQITEK